MKRKEPESLVADEVDGAAEHVGAHECAACEDYRVIFKRRFSLASTRRRHTAIEQQRFAELDVVIRTRRCTIRAEAYARILSAQVHLLVLSFTLES